MFLSNNQAKSHLNNLSDRCFVNVSRPRFIAMICATDSCVFGLNAMFVGVKHSTILFHSIFPLEKISTYSWTWRLWQFPDALAWIRCNVSINGYYLRFTYYEMLMQHSTANWNHFEIQNLLAAKESLRSKYRQWYPSFIHLFVCDYRVPTTTSTSGEWRWCTRTMCVRRVVCSKSLRMTDDLNFWQWKSTK